MCSVSMVTQHYQGLWPQYVTDHGPQWPVLPSPKEYADYKELLRKAAEYDRLTGQPDCPSKEKVEWQQELEKVLRERYGFEPKSA